MVTHRSNPQKDHPCAETRRLSHKAWKSVQRFDLGVGSRKKGKDRTGQESQKKSQGGNISPIWGEAPTVPIETKICRAGNLADVIMCAKFQGDIFRGYDFKRGQISVFLLIFAWALQQCSAVALPVIQTQLNCYSGREHTTQHRTHCGLWLRLRSWLMPQSPHRLRNDLKYVEWDVKLCSSQSFVAEGRKPLAFVSSTVIHHIQFGRIQLTTAFSIFDVVHLVFSLTSLRLHQ